MKQSIIVLAIVYYLTPFSVSAIRYDTQFDDYCIEYSEKYQGFNYTGFINSYLEVSKKSSRYFHDAHSVYFCNGGLPILLTGVVPDDFYVVEPKAINSQDIFGYDGQVFYFRGKPTEFKGIPTFEIVLDSSGFATNYVIVNSNLHYKFMRDYPNGSDSVGVIVDFIRTETIESDNIITDEQKQEPVGYISLEGGLYAKSENEVTYKGYVVPDVDVSSFELVNGVNLGKDMEGVYLNGAKIYSGLYNHVVPRNSMKRVAIDDKIYHGNYLLYSGKNSWRPLYPNEDFSQVTALTDGVYVVESEGKKQLKRWYLCKKFFGFKK